MVCKYCQYIEQCKQTYEWQMFCEQMSRGIPATPPKGETK